MKNEDLEKTKCLDEDMKELKEEKKDIYEEYNNMLRERKYSNVQDELDNESDSEVLELDDKNFSPKDPIAEELKEKPQPEEKESIVKKLKEKWSSLSKKKKIIICVVSAIVLIAIIVGIILVVKNTTKKDKVGTTLPKEDVVVIKDNYIYKNGNLIFLNEDDDEIGSYECKIQDAEKCYVAFNRVDDDNLNRPINVYEDDTLLLNRMNIYSNRYAFVHDSESEDGAITLYDFKDDEEKDKFILTKAYTVDDKDYVIVQNEEGNYELCEMTNSGLKSVFEKEYKYLGIIEDKKENYVVAKLSTGYYLLDYEGKEVSKLIADQIFDYDDKYIVTVKDGTYSLYDFDNKQKATGYRFISLEKGIIAFVNKDNNLLLRDKAYTKLNEEGCGLKNDTYIVKNVFTSDKVKTKSEFAFQIKDEDDNVKITISNSNQDDYTFVNLNKKEANYNKSLKYYNYFNGRLYFYQDQEKESLLGSYSCSNDNDEIKEGELLPSCRPAFDTVFEDNDMGYEKERYTMIPIINERFVFIEDSSSAEKNVKLVDLKNSTVYDTYESVNTYFSPNNGELSHASNSNLQVVAKNKKGKFGTIVIKSDKISAEYSFSFNHIEKINGKILVQDKDNKWSIIYSKSSTSNSFDGKIRGYYDNYFKIMKDGKYYVYDGDGVAIQGNYKYVELYKDMYAGVDENNKLMLYDYNGNKIISESVQLKTTDYYGYSANAFMVAVSGNNIVISVYNDGKYDSYQATRIKPGENTPPQVEEPETQENEE